MTFVSRTIGSLFLIAMMIPSVSTAAERVAIETLEGTRFGKLQGINHERLILSIPHGKATISLTEVIDLSWDRPKGNNSTGQGEVIFTDGSVVPYGKAEIVDRSLHLGSIGPIAGVMNASLDTVRCWKLPCESTPASQSQWQDICEKSGATDLLVLRRRNSESIDLVEGIIKACHVDVVQFEYEGESIDIPWKRIYGLVFFQPATESVGSTVVVHGVGKLRLMATRMEADSQLLRLSNDNWQAELPLAAIRRIDLSAGKTQRLSEATVIESDWKPYIRPSTTGGPPQRNAAFNGRPLRLRFPDKRAAGVWRIETFEDGWALRSQSRVVLKLEPWARQLRGWIGIDPATATTGSAEVSILADGKTLLSFQVDGSSEPVEISLSVEGVQQLTLRVDYGENLDTGDNVHFVNFRVTR